MINFVRHQLKLIVILVCLGLALPGLHYWQESLYQSAKTYRSFLATRPAVPGVPLTPQVNQVVLVVIGGFGYDALARVDMPNLRRLREAGATAQVQSRSPSYTEPAWLTLISGVQPAFNNGARFEGADNAGATAHIETLFQVAQRQALESAMGASIAWQDLVPAEILAKSIWSTQPGEGGDQVIVDNLATLLKGDDLQLLLVYFNQADYAGRKLGGSLSEPYRAALQTIDLHLGALVSMLDFDRAALIIVGDYGHIAQGGHGGHDVLVLNQPFVMYGRKVISGVYSPIQQVDIAPTVAVLSGLSIPSGTQGRPLVEMIRLSEPDQAAVSLALARQRSQLAQDYLLYLGQELAPESELKKAQQFYDNGNFAGTKALTALITIQADTVMAQAEASRLTRERRSRFLVLVLVIVSLILLASWRRSELWSQAFMTAVVVVATFHGLYLLSGQPYSFSALTAVSQVWTQSSLAMALSMLAGVLFFMILLILQQFTRIEVILLSCTELALFTVLGFLGPALYGYWLYGLTVTWIFPDMAILYLYQTGLIHAVIAVVFSLGLPVIILPGNLLLQHWLAHYQQRQIRKLRTRVSEPQEYLQ